MEQGRAIAPTFLVRSEEDAAKGSTDEMGTEADENTHKPESKTRSAGRAFTYTPSGLPPSQQGGVVGFTPTRIE